MGKILLFYKYTPFECPKRILKWQQQICADLKLTGRIILANEGINGTVGGSDESCEIYKKIMLKHPQFHDMDIKESSGDASCFPRMRIVIKDEIVKLGTPKADIAHTGIHLTPDQTHELLLNKPEDLIILDARNKFEAEIGAFKDAIIPDIRHFRDFPEYIEKNLDQFKDKQVLMYCTGGIRCERATAYLKEKNVTKEVYQIEGGIHRYAEKYPDGFFRGKNYVFDGRIAMKVNDDILGRCVHCTNPCDEYTNCHNVKCNKHVIICNTCLPAYDNCCSVACKDLVASGIVKKRVDLVRVEVEEQSRNCCSH
jgi:predicted sulfurtransferase